MRHLRALALATAVGLVLAGCTEERGTVPTTPTTTDLVELFNAVSDRAAAPNISRWPVVEFSSTPASFRPLWPLYTFLLAEAHDKQGNTAAAQRLHRALVEWAASDPYQDSSGGSALAAVSLWRLLALNNALPASEADKRALLELASKYWQRRGPLAEGLFEAPRILGALPQMRESILRRLAVLAWSQGDRRKAYGFLDEYLAVARDARFDPTEQQILADAFAEGALPKGKTQLALGERLYKLGKMNEARTHFVDVLSSDDPTAVADANLQLAQYLRDVRGKACVTPALSKAVDAVLTSTNNPELVQRALLFRARKHLQRTCPIDVGGFERDLERLRVDYPRSLATHKALLTLAEFHLDRYSDTGEDAALERSLARFGQVRDLILRVGDLPETDQNESRTPATKRAQEMLGNAWFKPAIALYGRNRVGDKRHAEALLAELVERWPNGPLSLAGRFWRGRILAQLGEKRAAAGEFRATMADSPYDYYAIRARMWIQLGDQAAGSIKPDSKTQATLHDAYARSVESASLLGSNSTYSARLGTALASNIYPKALASYLTLRRDVFPGRSVEVIDLDELDRTGKLIPVVLMFALRQDAILAADKPATAGNRLQIARAVGNWTSSGWLRGDWPLAIFLTGAHSIPEDMLQAVQNDTQYLAAAYPLAFRDLIEKYADRSHLPPELLYAVMRTETVFNPVAESSRSALGLFQFIPPTFRALNEKWGLVDSLEAKEVESFLLTPESNIQLGARWFSEELLPKQEGNIFWALMAHNAGPGSVARWKAFWKRQGHLQDYEFMAESAQFEETRGFMRRTLTTIWIMQAAERFKQVTLKSAPVTPRSTDR